MSNPLSGLNFDRWWNVWVAVSTVALIACIASKERLFAGMALGSVIYGIGELANHEPRERILPGWHITSRARRWTAFGTFLNLLGLAIAIRCAYKAGLFS